MQEGINAKSNMLFKAFTITGADQLMIYFDSKHLSR